MFEGSLYVCPNGLERVGNVLTVKIKTGPGENVFSDRLYGWRGSLEGER